MSVDVIIPAYNAQATIERCIQSVLSQDHGDLRIHVFDDASSDETPAILTRLQRDHPNIHVTRVTQNVGAGVARNTLLNSQNLGSEYIAFLDADDQWLPGKIGKQIALMKQTGHPMSHSAMRVILDDGARIVSAKRLVSYQDMKFRNWIPMSSAILRADLVKSKSMPPLRKRQDYAYWLTLFRENGHSSVGLEEPATIYDGTVRGISTNKFENVIWNYRALRAGTGANPLSCSAYLACNIGWYIRERLFAAQAKVK